MRTHLLLLPLIAAVPLITSHASAITLEECQLGVSSVSPSASVDLPTAHTPEEWATCRDLMASAVESAPLRPMYNVDDRGFPENLTSTQNGDFAVFGADKKPGGAYQAFDPRRVVQGSSDISFRTASEVAWTRTDAQLIQAILNGGQIGTVAYPVSVGTIGTIGGILPSDLLRAPLLMPFAVDPLTYDPHAKDWEKAPVEQVRSCEEWVWKKYWQYSRFEDATKACGNDDDCVYDVAFATTSPPGIAGKTEITAIDGSSGGSLSLLHGIIAKNAFFGVSPKFLRDQRAVLVGAQQKYQVKIASPSYSGGCVDEGPGPRADSCSPYLTFRFGKHKDDDLETRLDVQAKLAKIDELLKKKLAYAVGADSTTVSVARAHGDTLAAVYPTEWDFHRDLHAKQAPTPMTAAERKAIAQRTQYLQDLVEEYTRISTLRACRAPANAAPALDKRIEEWRKAIINPPGPVDDLNAKPSIALQNLLVGSLRGDLLPAGYVVSGIAGGTIVPAFLSRTFASPFSVGPAPSAPMSPRSLTTGGRAKLTEAEISSLYVSMIDRVTDRICTIDQTLASKTLNTVAENWIERAEKVQEEIVDLLLEEYGRGEEGCLSEAGYKCDWSPTFFAQRLTGQLADEREGDHGKCIAFTHGGNVSEAGSLATVQGLPTFFAKQQEELVKRYRDFPKVSTDGESAIGEKDVGNLGGGDSEWFNAGYNYSLGYSIKPTQWTGTTGDAQLACAFEVNATAKFAAGAGILDGILGKACPTVSSPVVKAAADELGVGAANTACDVYSRLKHLVDVTATVQTKKESGHYDVNVTLANERLFADGDDFINPSVAAGEKKLFEVHAVIQPAAYETKPRISSTVVVVVVPVTFQAYGELRLGANFDAYAAQKIDCNSVNPQIGLGAFLGFRPYAIANAVGSAAVGVSGLQAGVRGRITLIDAKLPISAALTTQGSGSFIQLKPEITADFTTEVLSGSMSAFAEIGTGIFSYTAEKEFFNWHGWTKTMPIWHFTPAPIDLLTFKRDLWNQFNDGTIGGSGGI